MAEDTVAAVVDPVAQSPAVDPHDAEIADLHARFDELEKILREHAPTNLGADVIAQTKGAGATVRAFNASIRASKSFGRAVAVGYRVLDGLKTVIIMGGTLGLALAQELQYVDLSPYIEWFLPAGSKISTAQAVAIVSGVGLLLRSVTNSEMFARWRKPKVEAGGASDSAVDEPQG